ncbi:hypothetical protein PQI66_00435 [Corynebacterium sp. USCH3]|uniref:hypothetical protein n=1 Tax=Corynebacterium sp. USCH3 TaxID=3024840 RepID=UPI0030A5B22E
MTTREWGTTMAIPPIWPETLKAMAKVGGPAKFIAQQRMIGMVKGLGLSAGITGAAYMLGQAKGRSDAEDADQT